MVTSTAVPRRGKYSLPFLQPFPIQVVAYSLGLLRILVVAQRVEENIEYAQLEPLILLGFLGIIVGECNRSDDRHGNRWNHASLHSIPSVC
jgi:hypothetical protein